MQSSPTPQSRILSILAAGVTLLTLDFLWLGWLAKPLYSALGPLQRPEPFWPAALLFYGMYLLAIERHALAAAQTLSQAAKRGAELGFVAYATYELTNWAVIRDWPALLVPVDLLWGVLLTSLSACAGHLTQRKLR